MENPELSDFEYNMPTLGDIEAHKRELKKVSQRWQIYPINPLWMMMNPHVALLDLFTIFMNTVGILKGISQD